MVFRILNLASFATELKPWDLARFLSKLNSLVVSLILIKWSFLFSLLSSKKSLTLLSKISSILVFIIALKLVEFFCLYSTNFLYFHHQFLILFVSFLSFLFTMWASQTRAFLWKVAHFFNKLAILPSNISVYELLKSAYFQSTKNLCQPFLLKTLEFQR